MKKFAGKVLALIFWNQDGILPTDYLPKDQTINAEYYSSLLIQLKDILKEKHHKKVKTMPRLTGHLQPRRNWPTWASNVLITHPILQTWPRWTTCSLGWGKKKKFERSPFFVRRRGYCCCRDLVRRTTF